MSACVSLGRAARGRAARRRFRTLRLRGRIVRWIQRALVLACCRRRDVELTLPAGSWWRAWRSRGRRSCRHRRARSSRERVRFGLAKVGAAGMKCLDQQLVIARTWHLNEYVIFDLGVRGFGNQLN